MTPLQRLLSDRLGRDLGVYLSEARAAGRSVSEIADDLTVRTGVKVSRMSVWNWSQAA